MTVVKENCEMRINPLYEINAIYVCLTTKVQKSGCDKRRKSNAQSLSDQMPVPLMTFGRKPEKGLTALFPNKFRASLN